MKFILGKNRATYSLTAPLEALISPDHIVRRIDLFVENLDLAPLGLRWTLAKMADLPITPKSCSNCSFMAI